MEHRIPRTAVTVIAVVAAMAGAGCGSPYGGGGRPEDAGRAAPEPSPSYAASIPEGWSRGHVDGLTFAHPGELVPRSAEDRAQPGAKIELGGPVNERTPVSHGLFVFEQTGSYGDARVQALTLAQNYKAQLGVQPVRPAEQLNVPGAEAALLLEFRFRHEDEQHPEGVPSRQFEIYVQAPKGGPLYGIRFGGPTGYLERETADRLVRTLRVTPAATATRTPRRSP